MVRRVANLISSEMAVRVEDFGFVVEFVMDFVVEFVVDFVVEMVMKVEGSDFEVVAADFVVECVGEDIVNFEKISHKDFVLLVPKVEIEVEVERKCHVLKQLESQEHKSICLQECRS